MSDAPTITPVEVVEDERGGLPSASSMKRTRRCPGWLNLARTLPKEKDSADASAGQARHSMIELEIDPNTVDDQNESYVLAQSARLRERAIAEAGLAPDSPSEKEVRYWVHDDNMETICSARLDHLVIGPDFGLIVDYKTLFGKHSPAHANEQLAVQAVAAAEFHGFARVRVALIQPNLTKECQLTQAEFTEGDLLYAKREILRWCYAAQDPNAPRIPGRAQCEDCPCRANCPEAIAAGVAITIADVREIDTPEKVAWALDRAELAIKVAKAIQEKAKRMMSDGAAIPGWKLTPGDTKRSITDAAKLAGLLAEAGASQDEISAIAKIGISDADKLYYRLRKAADGLTAAKAKEELEQKLAAAGALEKKQNQPSIERE